MWNAVEYFQDLHSKLKTTNFDYHFCRVSGLNMLEDVLTNFTRKNAFFAVDDSDDGSTVSNSGGYFNRRTIAIFILKKYTINNMEEREAVLNECRNIYISLLSKILVDKSTVPELMYVDNTRIPYHEVPGQFAGGTTGLYFVISIDEPINLVYNAAEWE